MGTPHVCPSCFSVESLEKEWWFRCRMTGNSTRRPYDSTGKYPCRHFVVVPAHTIIRPVERRSKGFVSDLLLTKAYPIRTVVEQR